MPAPAAPPSAPSSSLQPHWYPPLQLALAAAAWSIGVASAGRLELMVAPLLAAALIALHAVVSRRPGDELRLIVSAMMIGMFADSLLSAAGLVVPAPFTGQVAPPWQLALWTLPGAALHTYLRWMSGRRALATLCAACAAALGCLAAQRLGALRFPAGTLPALGASALSWALAMPLLLSWTARIDRQRRKPADAAIPAQPQ
jgi:hypothetical protein